MRRERGPGNLKTRRGDGWWWAWASKGVAGCSGGSLRPSEASDTAAERACGHLCALLDELDVLLRMQRWQASLSRRFGLLRVCHGTGVYWNALDAEVTSRTST